MGSEKNDVNKGPEESEEAGELMYVKCAYCGKWMDVKPGQLNWVSHGLCEDCLRKELDKVKGGGENAEGSTDQQNNSSPAS